MSWCTANGYPVVRGNISRPRHGAWQADLYVNARAAQAGAFTGAVEVGVGEHRWTGWAYRSGTFKDAIWARVVGGAGGFGSTLPAKAYLNVPLRIPLTDICTEAGERLSPRADAGVMGTNLPKWVRIEQTAGTALAGLLRAVPAATWRVLDDGTLWVGPETWPEVTLDQVDVIEADVALGRTEIATDTPWVLAPGVTWRGRRVSYVEHRIDPKSLRHVVWFEDASG